jgi:hypothetical protein
MFPVHVAKSTTGLHKQTNNNSNNSIPYYPPPVLTFQMGAPDSSFPKAMSAPLLKTHHPIKLLYDA